MTGSSGYRVLGLDLDGTIVSAALEAAPEDVAALSRARAEGLEVVVVTGRPYPSARQWVESFGLPGPVVCYQGAQVRDLDGSVLLDDGVPAGEAARVIEHARRRDIHVQIYRDDQLLIERDRPEARAYARHAGIRFTLVPDLVAALGPSTPKLVMVGEPEQMLAEMRAFPARFGDGMFATTSEPTYLEITNAHANKRSALEFVCARLGVSSSQVVAAGDARNDIPMVAWAGLGVAVEGAPPELLEAADMVIPGPGRGGVKQLVEHILGRA